MRSNRCASGARGPTLREAPAAGTDPHSAAQQTPPRERLSWKNYLGVFKYSRRAIRLVWATNRALAIGLALGSLIAGVLPSGIAIVGKHLLNSILAAARTQTAADRDTAITWLASELGLVIGMAVINRLLGMMRSLLRQQLGQKINVEILEKALTLELTQFEDSEVYDGLTRARGEAMSRPLSLVSQTFEFGQSLVTLATLGALLAGFSPIALGVLSAAAIIVLDRGAIIERGSHDELVAQGGRYATLFNLQAQGYR
jgi:ATP-binding cassette subfamily B protein